MLGFISASIAAGLILLMILGAPRVLAGYLAFMLASVCMLAVVTVRWKISMDDHTVAQVMVGALLGAASAALWTLGTLHGWRWA